MTTVIPLQPQLYVRIGGADVPGDLSHDIARVEVDMHLYLPDTFTVEIHDGGFRWVEHALVKIGQQVEIAGRASEDEQRASDVLLSGEIVSIEATFPESGVPTLILRGYDLSHRLHRGKKVRSFLQMTDSDIAQRIAQERGLQALIDSTSHVHPQLSQENLTDYEFLARRARAVGYVFTLDGRQLIFRKPANVALPPIELNYREGLLDFRPRLTSSAQVNDLNVRGWDPATKRPIVGRARTADYRTATLGFDRRGSDFAQQAFGAVETAFADEPVASQAEGDEFASAHISRFWSGDVHAEGLAMGNPKLRAGSVVTLTGIGDRFGGEYFVTHVRHTFGGAGEYRTEFTVGGYGPDTTADLLFSDAARIEQHAAGVTRGLAIGVVTNTNDPDGGGRVKVKFPWLADDAESDWMRVAAPMAGADRGFFFLPEVNDEVLLGFEHGDFNRPFVIGALWNGVDATPIGSNEAVDGSGQVVKRIIKTRAGHIILLDDTPGSEKIEIVDKDGSNLITIDSAGGKISLEAKMEIAIKAGQKISLSAPQVQIDGSQRVALSGAEIDSSASARHKIAGGIVEIN